MAWKGRAPLADDEAPAYPYPKKQEEPHFDFSPSNPTPRQKMLMEKEAEQEVEISKLSASPKNSFHKIADDVFEELKASIKANGLVYPIVIRPKANIQNYAINGEYEILAGHNRVRAAIDLGMEKIKAKIVCVDDVAAVRMINDSNLQRGDVSELEKAWAYRELAEAMNKKGNNQYTDLGDEEDVDTVSTSSSEVKKTRDLIAEMYGLNGRTVQRKIRLTYLCDDLYKLYDKRELSQKMAVNLSYLDTSVQKTLLEDQKLYKFPWTENGCEDIRKDYNSWRRDGVENEYSRQRMLRIMQAAEPEPVEKVEKPKRYKVADELFPADLKKKERDAYITKALRYIVDNGIAL